MLDEYFGYEGTPGCSQTAPQEDSYRVTWGVSAESIRKTLEGIAPKKSGSNHDRAQYAGTSETWSTAATSSVGLASLNKVKRSSANAGLASPTRLGGMSVSNAATSSTTFNSNNVGRQPASRFAKRRRRVPSDSGLASTSGDRPATVPLDDLAMEAMFSELSRRLDAKEHKNALAAMSEREKENACRTAAITDNRSSKGKQRCREDIDKTLLCVTNTMSQELAAIKLAPGVRDAQPKLHAAPQGPKIMEATRTFDIKSLPNAALEKRLEPANETRKQQSAQSNKADTCVLADYPPILQHRRSSSHTTKSSETAFVVDSQPRSASTSWLAQSNVVESKSNKPHNDSMSLDVEGDYWQDDPSFEMALSQIREDDSPAPSQRVKRGGAPASPAKCLPATRPDTSDTSRVLKSTNEKQESPKTWVGFARRDQREAKTKTLGQGVPPVSAAVARPLEQSDLATSGRTLSSKPLAPKIAKSPNPARNLTSETAQVPMKTISKEAVLTSRETVRCGLSRTGSRSLSTSRSSQQQQQQQQLPREVSVIKPFKRPTIVQPAKANAAREKVAASRAALACAKVEPLDLAAEGLDESIFDGDWDQSF